MPDRSCPGHHSIERPAPALRDDEYLCRGCARTAERILGDLPSLTRDLETTVTRQDRTSGGSKRTAGAERPLPVNLTASDRGREVLALLFEWADFVAGWHRAKGLPILAAHRPLTELVPHAVAILLRNADWIRSNEQGPDLARALHCIRRDMRRLIDRRPERLYAGPCQADLGYDPELRYDCRLPLYREWGADAIACDGHTPNMVPGQWVPSGCGHTHPAAERATWLIAQVQEQLLPLRLVWENLYVLIPGCQIDWPIAKQWTRARHQRIVQPGKKRARVIVTPARLEPQGWADDEPLYRGADILRLAEDKPTRRGRRRVRRVNVA